MKNTISRPWIKRQLSIFLPDVAIDLSNNHQKLLYILDHLDTDGNALQTSYNGIGRPKEDRSAIFRAFIAKAVFNIPTTRALIERLELDPVLRRLCGLESTKQLHSEATFSRAFSEYSNSGVAQVIHEKLIKKSYENTLVLNVSRDSSSIKAREKPVKTEKKIKIKKRRGRPAKGSPLHIKPVSLLEKQPHQTLEQMLEDLPKHCGKGAKKDSKGNSMYWNGFKLHLDAAQGGVPISCLLTSASLHDSQAALPLSKMSHARIKFCYELMDAAYDAASIHQCIKDNGAVPIIDSNKRRGQEGRILSPFEKERYKDRTTVERVFSELKDNYGARNVRVRGNNKVMCHLMFGILSLTVIQLCRLNL